VWRLWVDTGGTFTDCLGRDPEGRLHRAKVLSNGALRARVHSRPAPRRLRLEGGWTVPDDFFRGATLRFLGDDTTLGVVASAGREGALELDRPIAADEALPGRPLELRTSEEAPILAARLITATPAGRPLPPMELRLATTRGTNALLERRGAPTLLLVTRGFRDLLEIGTQQRPDLFALDVRKMTPLPIATLEVDERLQATGTVQEELDLEALDEALDALDPEIETAAVALLHSYRNPEHESQVGERLRRRGFRHVSLSSRLAPLIKLLPRAETTVVDAYLSPQVGEYFAAVMRAVPDRRVLALTSSGGLVSGTRFSPKDSLLSGPAGGVVGAVRAAAASGVDRLLAFDMGGTSTDVSRYDRDFERRFETRVAGVSVLAPSLAIESVAAGGGSICRFDGRRLTVGPDSAGADPGPACYGAGGPLTLTDVNLLLGRLAPDRFEIPIDVAAARQRFTELATPLQFMSDERLLEGLLRIANERMTETIRRISLRRGYRPAEYTLVAFGGAGGQHACALAEMLDISTVLVPADAGVLSALGVGSAALERFAQRQVLKPLQEVENEALPRLLHILADEAGRSLAADGVPNAEMEISLRRIDLRWRGQEDTLALDAEPLRTLLRRFIERYESVFGYHPTGATIEVEAVRVGVASRRPGVEVASRPPASTAQPSRRQRALVEGDWRQIPVFVRDRLTPGAHLAGPALVVERHSATYVAPDWDGEIDGARALVLRRSAGPTRTAADTTDERQVRSDD
jgi:5-oxoprolinase (ATP-hydrolysing)